LGDLELCLGGLRPPKHPWRRDWLPTDVYFEDCITQICQVKHRPFGAQHWLQRLTFDELF